MSIHESNAKCPRCSTVPDPQTGRCLCPEPVEPVSAPRSGALLAQAEALFETYLAARLVRARRQVTAAKVALLREPRSRTRLEELRRAEQEVERLQAQLVEQVRRTAQARAGEPRDAANTAPAEPPAGAQAEPTESFRALQAAKAEEIAASRLAEGTHADERECPNCGARVPGEAWICGCGYAFRAAGDEVAAEPFLTDEELAALRQPRRP
ncbi:MAG TPA: hypothetical protein VF203_04005 [Burkholderiales bacterium]